MARWNKNSYSHHDDYYFYRKLAMVNSLVILENYQKIEKENGFSLLNSIPWILLIVGIGSFALITGILLKLKRK